MDPEEKMMKLDHVLEKLRNLDPKTFGMLNNMMDQAQAQSFLQTQDPKTAAMLSKMVGGASFLQTSGPEMDPEEKMMKLDHVLEKLHSLDPKTFGMLNNMLDKAQA